MNPNRRDFIKKTALAGTGALLFGCTDNEKIESANVDFNKSYNWRMVTAWSPHFPLLGEGAEDLAKNIETMSGGRIKIKVYGGGELVPPLETFDAVSQGVAELGHSASYYWAGKTPAAQFFTSLPFGMNTSQMNAWLYYGGGIDLWHEVYRQFNLLAFPCGNTGAQMGGWFNKEINSINDVKGLKIRFPGIGGKVINKAGGSAVLSAGSEIYTNLERGVIDATDWIGPYHDYLMGFHEIAKYYYYPSWAEPTGVIELLINKSAYESLPIDLQSIVKEAASIQNAKLTGLFKKRNAEYYNKLKNETKVEFRKFPDDVLNSFKKFSKEAIDEIVQSDSMSYKVFESYKKYHELFYSWDDIVEPNYQPL